MIRKVDKFFFDYNTGHIIMPKSSIILKVEKNSKDFMLWALVNPDLPLVNRAIRIYSTGQEIDEEYIGTYIDTVYDGPYVWHIFDRGEIVSVKPV